MSTQIYLDLTVEGKSVAGHAVHKLYESTIELLSFRWSMATKEASAQSRNTAAHSVQYKEVTCTKYFDVSSARLMNLMKAGTVIETADLWLEDQLVQTRQTDHSDNTAVLITLKKAWISKVALSMSDGNTGVSIKEDVTIRYKSMEFVYCWATKPGELRSLNSRFLSPVDGASS